MVSVMKQSNNDPVILSRFHNARRQFLKVSQGEQSAAVDYAGAARLAGVSPRTLERWCNGSQAAPPSALALFRVAYLGWMPWPEWAPFRLSYGLDNTGAARWLITHDNGLWWTPERLLMIGHGYDAADDLRREIATLRATVNALTTRQAPPIPCAEIIPGPWTKKSPA